jgi:arginase
MALIGLREVSYEESRLIRRSRISAYTLEDIDALGMREVIYRALRTAGMGTDGIHVALDMDALDTPWRQVCTGPSGAGFPTGKDTLPWK